MNPSFSHKVCHVLQDNDRAESLILMPGSERRVRRTDFSPMMSGEGNKDFGNFLDKSKGMEHSLKKKSGRQKKQRHSSEEGKRHFLRENQMTAPRVGQAELARWAEKLFLKRSHETAGKNPHQLMSSDSHPRNSPKC